MPIDDPNGHSLLEVKDEDLLPQEGEFFCEDFRLTPSQKILYQVLILSKSARFLKEINLNNAINFIQKGKAIRFSFDLPDEDEDNLWYEARINQLMTHLAQSSIVHLDMDCSELHLALDDEAFNAFAAGLAQSNIKTLNLSRNFLEQWSTERIALFMGYLAQSKITALDLGENKLSLWDESQRAAFREGIVQSKLTVLQLDGINFFQWDEAKITDFMNGIAQSSVTMLSLRHNRLSLSDESKIDAFMHGLAQSCITDIDFSGDLERGFGQWDEPRITSLVKGLGLSQIKRIKLDGHFLQQWDNERIALFMQGLSLSEVEFLDNGGGRFKDWDEQTLTTFMSAFVPSKIRAVNLSNCLLENPEPGKINAFIAGLAKSGISSLDFRGNQLKSWSCPQLTDFMQSLIQCGVSSLDLALNDLDELSQEAFDILTQGLTQSSITSLVLRHTLTMPKRITAVINALPKKQAVSLNLDYIQIGKWNIKDFMEFVGAIKRSSICSLSLRSSDIGSSWNRAKILFLTKSKLISLDLKNNSMGSWQDEKIILFAKILQKKSITHINMEHCDFNDEQKQLFRLHLIENPKLNFLKGSKQSDSAVGRFFQVQNLGWSAAKSLTKEIFEHSSICLKI